jgi:hypothetical protein
LRRIATRFRDPTAASAPTATLVSDRPSAQQTYDTEIARLRVVVARRRRNSIRRRSP